MQKISDTNIVNFQKFQQSYVVSFFLGLWIIQQEPYSVDTMYPLYLLKEDGAVEHIKL